MKKNFLVHALFGHSQKHEISEEFLKIWEVVYLLKADNEVHAHEAFMIFIAESDLSSCHAVTEEGDPIISNFLGVRIVSECPDEEFLWEYKYGNVVEISYIEYYIEVNDLENLKSGQRVSVEFTKIKRRISSVKTLEQY
jgi:hypothetical protein